MYIPIMNIIPFIHECRELFMTNDLQFWVFSCSLNLFKDILGLICPNSHTYQHFGHIRAN